MKNECYIETTNLKPFTLLLTTAVIFENNINLKVLFNKHQYFSQMNIISILKHRIIQSTIIVVTAM